MRQYKKPMKFYFTIFVLTSLIVLGYSIYLFIAANAELQDLIILWILPFFFTMIYYGGDSLMQWIANKRKKIDYEGLFLSEIGRRMNESKSFLIEEFRRLQTSEKFQTQVKVAYEIYQSGETENYTIEKLKKKFRADSIEGRAMVFVIEYVEEKLSEDLK